MSDEQLTFGFADEAPQPFDIGLWCLEEDLRNFVTSVEVESSNIVAVGYDPRIAVMHIKFSSGATYRYSKVLFAEYWALVNAESVGKYFATHIRNCRDITCIKEG
jgi:hypothetical protein